MNVSPTIRYYVRRLLAEHPAVESLVRDQAQPFAKQPEELLDRYIKLDYLTYPQLNELEFLIELYQKIKVNEPEKVQQLKTIEKKIFQLVASDLPVADDTVAELATFFSHSEETPKPTTVTPTNASTLRQYAQYLQRITEVTERYLGKMIVRNYWLLTRPKEPWLSRLNLEQGFQGLSGDRPLGTPQVEALEQWIHAFVRHASRVLPSLPQLLLAAGIPAELLYDLVRDTA